jgi:hypothetical protein
MTSILTASLYTIITISEPRKELKLLSDTE